MQHQRLTNLNSKRPPNPARPFWISGTSYYLISVSVSLFLFFCLWGILEASNDSTPWITSGIIASLLLLGAVLMREIILRDMRNKYILASKRFDAQGFVKPVRRNAKNVNDELSLQLNVSKLKLIEKKSEIARAGEHLPHKHLEVFELCDDYLKLTYRVLKKVEIGSTKWGAIKNGRKRVKEVHKHHLLSWAAIESRRLTQEAKIRGSIADKIETARRASLVLESALSYYPEDKKLMESIEAISDFVASIKITHWIELAEKSSFKGNYKKAVNYYKDALFYLARENVVNINKDEIAENINSEIKKIRKLKS